MKITAALFTLLVVCCAQISGQLWRGRWQGDRGLGRGFNRWGIRNNRRGLFVPPKFPSRRFPWIPRDRRFPWTPRDQRQVTFQPITAPTTLPELTTRPTVRDLPTTSTISPTFPELPGPLGGPIEDPFVLLKKAADLPGGMPGGLNDVTEITQGHRDIAAFAAGEIGSEYTMTDVRKVKEQIVQGINYHMDITVTKTKDSVIYTLECKVIVHNIPWLAVTDINTLTEFTCTRIPDNSL